MQFPLYVTQRNYTDRASALSFISALGVLIKDICEVNMAKDLITKAEYKAYAGINSTNHDAEIDSLIPKVSALIKTYCGRSFIDYYDDPKVEQFNGGVGAFILSEGPVVSIQSVEHSTDYGQTYTALVEYTDWVLDQDTYVVCINPAGWPSRLKGYKITYTAGYEKVPEDLKLAILDLVTYYKQNDAAVHSPKAPGTNSVQIEYISTTTLPAHIRRILDLYKADYT